MAPAARYLRLPSDLHTQAHLGIHTSHVHICTAHTQRCKSSTLQSTLHEHMKRLDWMLFQKPRVIIIFIYLFFVILESGQWLGGEEGGVKRRRLKKYLGLEHNTGRPWLVVGSEDDSFICNTWPLEQWFYPAGQKKFQSSGKGQRHVQVRQLGQAH